MRVSSLSLLLVAFGCVLGCSGPERVSAPAPEPAAAPSAAKPTAQPEPIMPAAQKPADPLAPKSPQLATFGSGCFWCTEAVLEQLDGVLDVTSGYMGGTVDNPTYKQICTGTTGHAEVVQVTFDEQRITYATLLEWFFRSHDPTTLNRQGADEGTQYRSAIFFHDAAQQKAARAAIARYQPDFADPIVTEVTAAVRFWPAEAYHQDYFRNNPEQGYCRVVIAPKLKKLQMPPRAK